MCHLSPITCHLSHVTCHVSRVTCHLSHVIFMYIPFFSFLFYSDFKLVTTFQKSHSHKDMVTFFTVIQIIFSEKFVSQDFTIRAAAGLSGPTNTCVGGSWSKQKLKLLQNWLLYCAVRFVIIRSQRHLAAISAGGGRRRRPVDIIGCVMILTRRGRPRW